MRISDWSSDVCSSDLLTRFTAGSETVYSIEPAHHPMASYYRNIIAHHFLDRAMIELALFELRDADSRDATEAFWAKVDRLRDLFTFEFFYPRRAEIGRESCMERVCQSV